jgi:tRNA(adenine34) deaminase
MESIHDQYLKECYRLAEVAREHGESGVGAVVVKNDQILGEGAEESRSRNDVTRHAEVVAILDAIAKHGVNACKGATLYSNVEPCILCSYVIRHYQIGQVFYVNHAGQGGGIHSEFPILTTDKISGWTSAPHVHEVRDMS